MNSALLASVARSIRIGSVGARRAFWPLLGLSLLVSGCRSCSYHAHSEWHAGSGGSGGEQVVEEGEQGEQGGGSTRRRSPGSRDNVVRVTGDGNKSHAGQGGSGDAPERTVVRPTGDVPPSSAGGASESTSGQGVQTGRSDGSAGAGGAGEPPGRVDEPAAPAQPAEPAADASADQASDSGKTTNKSPSEPHVTTPTQRKPRKVHRNGVTNKEGRRE